MMKLNENEIVVIYYDNRTHEIALTIKGNHFVFQLKNNGYFHPLTKKWIEMDWSVNFPNGFIKEWEPIVIDFINNGLKSGEIK